MKSNNHFKLIMVSAMYENGGNTTHRFLDGHPELFVYPFESQLGTSMVNDYLASLYQVKYRWPTFSLSQTPSDIYEAIIDQECKVRAKTPMVSKFRNASFEFSDLDRKKEFIRNVKRKSLSRALIIEAFFESTFVAWKNYNRSGREKAYVGYSPIVGVDGDKIMKDFGKNAYVFHVVRNPFSAYAETKKRPVPQSLAEYITGWNVCQEIALINQKKYSSNFFVIRYEDIVKNPKNVLEKYLTRVGVGTGKSLDVLSWNSLPIKEVYPWGTIKKPTLETNIQTAKELTADEIKEISLRCEHLIKTLNYHALYKKIAF